MKHNTLFLMLSLCAIFAYKLDAQITTCEDGRYELDIFSSANATLDVYYGSGQTISGQNVDLTLDVFEPKNDDPTVRRPVIMLAFGGSFITGDKQDVHVLCRAYARKGYVAVAIDYRLYDLPLFPLPSSEEMIEVVIKSVSDMKAAIRFMREDADTADKYKIDPNNIIVGGVSAGAIVAAHAATLDMSDPISGPILTSIEANGGFEGNTSDNYQYSSEVQGLINLSGALSTAELITDNDPPMFSVHDEFDDVVPYGNGAATILGIEIIEMNGSKTMHEQATDLGINNELITILGSDEHVSYLLDQDVRKDLIDASAVFTSDIVCSSLSSNKDHIYADQISVYPNPTYGRLTMDVDQASISVNVLNALGQTLLQNVPSHDIDLTMFEGGQYYLEFTNKRTGKTQIKSVIKID